MELPDVNVLIYAFRKDSPHHAEAFAWLAGVIGGDEQFGVSPLALSALVRITTNARFRQPSTHAEAFAFCQDLMDQPHCLFVEPGRDHWRIFSRLCIDANATGPLVSDAWYAALAIEHGCEWITFDADFARFPRLRWRMLASV